MSSVAYQPENTDEAVQAILDWFDVDKDTVVHVQVDDPAVADAHTIDTLARAETSV